MTPPLPGPSPRALAAIPHRRALLRLAGLLLATLLAGCVSEAPADYGLGLEVIRMDEHTRALLATRPWPAAEATRYLRASMGTLQSLHDRGLGHRSETPEAHLVEFLRRRFALLAAQKAPLTRKDIGRLAPAIADLRDLESRKGNDWRGDFGAATYSSEDAFDSTDAVSDSRRHGDRDEHRDHRDSDRRDHDGGDHGRHDGHDRNDHDDHGHHDDDKKH